MQSQEEGRHPGRWTPLLGRGEYTLDDGSDAVHLSGTHRPSGYLCLSPLWLETRSKQTRYECDARLIEVNHLRTGSDSERKKLAVTVSELSTSVQTNGGLGVTLEVLDKVDRELAELQTEEVLVFREGSVALLVGGIALGGIAAFAVLFLLIRRTFGARSQSEHISADIQAVSGPAAEEGVPGLPPSP